MTRWTGMGSGVWNGAYTQQKGSYGTQPLAHPYSMMSFGQVEYGPFEGIWTDLSVNTRGKVGLLSLVGC